MYMKAMEQLTKRQLLKLIKIQDKTIKDLKSTLHGMRISRGRWKSEAHQLKEVA